MRVTMQADWERYDIELKTTLERLVAQYIFGQSDYQEDGREITRALSAAFKANFDRVYDSPKEVSFMSSPENEPKIRAAFQAFIQQFKTVGDLSVEKAQEICDAIATPPVTASKIAPPSPQR